MGQEVVISCQRNFGSVIWAIDLPSGRISTIAVASLHLQRNITTLTFLGDPGCGFEVIILPTSNASCIRSELHVTAANKLHGVRVFCGTYNTTIQVSSVRKSTLNTLYIKDSVQNHVCVYA